MTVATTQRKGNTPSTSEIIKNQLYLGNLVTALSPDEKKRLGITHVVSVCPDYASTSANHLCIPVEDTEYDDLLIHLPQACSFIQSALAHGGRVLVHCVMGISRSSTVVAAFLMQTRRIPAAVAVSQLKKARPQVHLNYGFLMQLEVFARCDYQPASTHPMYRAWKRRHVQDVSRYLDYMVDTVAIVPDRLLVNSEFPTDPTQTQGLVLDMGVTHLVSLSPAEIHPCAALCAEWRHVDVAEREEDIMRELSQLCGYISKAIDEGGLVLVHSTMESRACLAACAYLMSERHFSAGQALKVIEGALPLFNPTNTFMRTLQRLHAYIMKHSGKSSVSLMEAVQQQKQHDAVKPSNDLQKAAASLLHDVGISIDSLEDKLHSIGESASNQFIRVQ